MKISVFHIHHLARFCHLDNMSKRYSFLVISRSFREKKRKMGHLRAFSFSVIGEATVIQNGSQTERFDSISNSIISMKNLCVAFIRNTTSLWLVIKTVLFYAAVLTMDNIFCTRGRSAIATFITLFDRKWAQKAFKMGSCNFSLLIHFTGRLFKSTNERRNGFAIKNSLWLSYCCSYAQWIVCVCVKYFHSNKNRIFGSLKLLSLQLRLA